MANAKSTDDYYQYATVDTAPVAAGYWTNAVNARQLNNVRDIYFSIRGTGEMVVTLQFKCSGDDDWTDHETYTVSQMRIPVPGRAAGVRWRAGVKSGDRISGELTFGFDW